MVDINFYHFHVNQESKWINYFTEGVAALNHFDLFDVTSCNSREELCAMVGLDRNSKAAKPKELWQFRNAQIGDVIFTNKTNDICIGIGIIESNYSYNLNRNNFRHRRKVKWITKKEFTYNKAKYTEHFKATGKEPYKELFYAEPFDTVVAERGIFLLKEYIEKYPELEALFDKINLL